MTNVRILATLAAVSAFAIACSGSQDAERPAPISLDGFSSAALASGNTPVARSSETLVIENNLVSSHLWDGQKGFGLGTIHLADGAGKFADEFQFQLTVSGTDSTVADIADCDMVLCAGNATGACSVRATPNADGVAEFVLGDCQLTGETSWHLSCEGKPTLAGRSDIAITPISGGTSISDDSGSLDVQYVVPQ